jgi:hypothetical protein
LNEQNFVKRVSFLAPGDGYRKCAPLNLLADIRGSTGLVLDGSTTTPTIAVLETGFYGLSAAASTTHLALFHWVVPQDYDPSADELRIMIACQMAGTTNQALSKITPLIYRKRPVPQFIPDDAQGVMPAGLAISLDLGAPATAVGAIPLAGSDLATKWVMINADYWTDLARNVANRSLATTADASIKPGDILNVVLTSAAHTTDLIAIYGIELWYRSNLAFTDINSR